jgi:hypothetical protein
MRETMLRKVLVVAVVIVTAGVIVGTSPLSIGQEAKEKKVKGKLPAYFADIVTDSQRQQIYSVQEKYSKQIADLNSQLETVTKQRDSEIESLLNADQKEKLKKAREEGAAKKKKAAEEKKGAEEGKTKTAK